MSNNPVILQSLDQVHGLARKLREGQIFLLRGGLQQLGLFETTVAASLDGIQNAVGPKIRELVEQYGFDRIHEWVEPTSIATVTDAVLAAVRPRAYALLNKMLLGLFPGTDRYYFECNPNVRFHIPYDLAAKARYAFSKFAARKGQGKISAHGPHRDCWVDCPDNAINVWVAVGPVRRGNGLSIFADDYSTDLVFRNSYIVDGQRLRPPVNFDMEPGDMLLFHGNHIHASELNRTDATRHVISFRFSFDKPHFPNGHYHVYADSRMAAGALSSFATLPALLQASYVASCGRRLRQKLVGLFGNQRAASATAPAAMPAGTEPDDLSIALSQVPVGAIRPVSRSICVARLDQDRFVAIGRRCPHMAADLADGWVDNGEIVCPTHNLRIDPITGASACQALPLLPRFACTLDHGATEAGKQQTACLRVIQ